MKMNMVKIVVLNSPDIRSSTKGFYTGTTNLSVDATIFRKVVSKNSQSVLERSFPFFHWVSR